MACLVRTVLVVMAVFLSTGCASSGNLSIADVSSETVAMQLHKGRTSQADVRRLFGDPLKTSFSSNGNETWEYEFSRLQSKPTNFIPYVSLVHSGAEGEKKSLVVFFDKSKLVQDFTMSTSQIDISRGLIAR
jgi:outer membrane protein assembly factor BamE (lipoprotein component of BamABCDE complex)